MAPALTEPLSPTEKLTSSAVTAAATPTTRSSRKIENTGNKSNTNTAATNNVLKPTQPIRDKRNRSGGIAQITNPTPTSSKRITRSRDHQQQPNSNSANPLPDNTETKLEQKLITTPKKQTYKASGPTGIGSVNSTNNILSPDTKNEQMGLSTAPLNTKTKVLNNNNNKNLNTVDNTKDSSTAQLLADLTNEAITAEICLRNQLKDVNLVKTSGEPSSPIQQETSFVKDIIAIKANTLYPLAAAASSDTDTSIAHMEAQSNECSKTLQVQPKTSDEEQNIETTTQPTVDEEKLNLVNDLKDHIKHEQEQNELKHEKNYDKDMLRTESKSCRPQTGSETEHDIDTSIGSPADSDEADTTTTKKTKDTSKIEIVSVQELPPVSTDSTMTASEVEDNLEERLSQLDGTAIDSPPPNHDIDRDSTGKTNHNSVATATPPRTPTHQQTLTQDMQQLQQQLQHTPPTPISQQVQAHHQNMQQQQNCFTPQSTTSSINTLGSGNIPQSFIKESDGGGGAELEDQDIEEVFKVLKGFEGGTTSDINVCDLNVLFNEVYMKINETEMSGNASGVGGGGSNQSHVTVASPSIQLVKPSELAEDQQDIEKRQQQMQRKIDFLMRRLRKLQARYMCKHSSEEIAGLFEWSARQASKGVIHNTTPLPLVNEPSTSLAETIDQDPSKYFLKVIAARPPATDWKEVQDSLVPATQITTLLRKIESVANAQQLCITPSQSFVNVTNRRSKKALMEAQAASVTAASNSLASAYAEGKAEEIVVATLEENVTDELRQVAGLLQSEMSEVQRAIDSDATESSSGGESADEMVTYNNTQQQTLPIRKRAAWRYSRDRAAIASRWSWLLSQISDLEIKIRQHSELHQEIVRSKGLVTCGQMTENGFKVMDQNITAAAEQDTDELMGSCRTRGYIPSQFRKRKLIQTTNIHTISKKAARPSTIKCGCQWPLHPCALCTGRLDPTAPRDLPDTMMMSDRIALLDSGYHPVLSFRENVNNALHFEAIAKQPEWQQRVMRCQAKNIAKNVWRAEREAVASASGGHHSSSSSKKYSEASSSTKRRYIKKKDRVNNEEKTGGGGGTGKSIKSTVAGFQQQNAVTTSAATASSSSTATTTSLIDAGNGTAILSTSTTTSTTPLVANKGISKNAKKQQPQQLVEDGILKEPANHLRLPPPYSTTTIPYNAFIHQTSDCLPINYDPYNPNQIPSSLISSSNNNSSSSNSKSHKHRKLSSSTAINSHTCNNNINNNNHHHHLYNGESNYMPPYHDNWGGGENYGMRSRTSSPTYGSSGNNYHKYERSLDRKNRTSYDIDNIVIPYSVAAATRVEILPYKEIPTPKWRVIENECEESNKLEISQNLESQLKTSALKPLTNGNFCDNNMDSIKTDDAIVKTNESNEKVSNYSKDIDLKLKENHGDKNVEKLNESSKHPSKDIKLHHPNIIKEEVAEQKKEVAHKPLECNGGDDIQEPEPKKLRTEEPVVDLKTEVELDEDKLVLQNSLNNSSMDEDEDISDDAMFFRHERALTEERRKFQTYLKFPWSTRSRANRRIDSRAESSGANTPDPASPAPQTPSVGGGDQESIPSPLTPSTPMNPLDTISEAGDNSTSFLGVGSLTSLSSKHYERRRTTSTKRDRDLERRSSTPDSKELIPPYEALKYPLSDEQFEELMRAMPSEHSEDSKRFDDCYLPGGSGGGVVGGVGVGKYPRTISGSTSKRTSRASTMCGDMTATLGGGGGGSGRRIKGSHKNLRPVSADDTNVSLISPENGDMLLYDEDDDDDYPKHHLAPNDDHLTADSCGGGGNAGISASGVYDDDDVYGDHYGAYVGRGHQQRKHRDSDGESTDEEEPFQDDDPNDPEWRGETEERFRKKV